MQDDLISQQKIVLLKKVMHLQPSARAFNIILPRHSSDLVQQSNADAKNLLSGSEWEQDFATPEEEVTHSSIVTTTLFELWLLRLAQIQFK